ncbi:MAG: hypothetical protein II779_17700, partial [Clostridia bacterium]|nr:hypothetical protein [Clostridia bacterium]
GQDEGKNFFHRVTSVFFIFGRKTPGADLSRKDKVRPWTEVDSIIQPDFSLHGRLFRHERGKNSRGGEDAEHGKKDLSDRDRLLPEPVQGVGAEPDAQTDRAVLARTVVIRFGGDIENGKQHGGKDQKTQKARRDPSAFCFSRTPHRRFLLSRHGNGIYYSGQNAFVSRVLGIVRKKITKRGTVCAEDGR